jgi:hypothetical protein
MRNDYLKELEFLRESLKRKEVEKGAFEFIDV